MSDTRLRDLERALEHERRRAGLDVAFMRAQAENRIGAFFVEDDVIRNHPDVAQAVMARVLVIEAQFSYVHRAIRYTGFSPDFERVPEGMSPRVYELHRDMRDYGDGMGLERLRFAVDGPAQTTIGRA